MKIFRRGPGPRVKKNVLQLVLLLPLLIAAVLSSSGCAGVVSAGGGNSPQQKQALLVISIALPGGTPQLAYSTTLAATGGTGPYSWSVTKGSLPAGLNISSSGVISGTPTQAGTSAFTVQATDSSSPAATASANLSITVTAAAPSPSDHHDVIAQRDDGHSLLCNAAGEWWNYALQLVCQRWNLARRTHSRGIDRSDLRNAHNCGNRVVHRASDRRSEQHRNQGVEHRRVCRSVAFCYHHITSSRHNWHQSTQLPCRPVAERLHTVGA